MGRLPVYQPPQPEPPETHEDGCPGGWYRCRFVATLLRYQRPYSQGVFSSNVFLDRCEDPLVLEATKYLEAEQLRAERRFLEAI